MKKSNVFWSLLQIALLVSGFSFFPPEASALTAGDTYTINLSKMNSDGSVTEMDSTTATADADGKIGFSFSSVPTSPDTNFLVLSLLDASDTVVRKSFVPAPPAGGTGELGLNELSTVQTNMILAALAAAGTDDPIVVAYGLILTRSPSMSDDDIQGVATLGRICIQQGFENMLLSNGVTAAQLATFKQKLVYNQPNKDLGNFTALFKSAVDNPAQATDDMNLAAGLIADIFIDAGVAADIDLSLILAAHDAAGMIAQSDPDAVAAFASFGSETGSIINQSMTNFNMRIQAVKLKASFSNAFTILNASGTQVTRFNTAVQAMISAMQDLDKQYGQYYEDPSLMTPAIQSAMDAAFSAVFETFQTAIAATDDEVADMKSAIAAAMGITVDDLPSDVGTYRNYDGDTVNWPIPQVVATNWVANILIAGGGLTYDRTTVASALPIPDNMAWLNNSSHPSGSGVRTDFVGAGMPASFATLMGMQEDMQIAEMTRNYIYDGTNPSTGGNPTPQQRQDANLAYAEDVELIMTSLSGTTDGATAISAEEKEALVRMMEHPNF
jgi:hypothetical protein